MVLDSRPEPCQPSPGLDVPTIEDLRVNFAMCRRIRIEIFESLSGHHFVNPITVFYFSIVVAVQLWRAVKHMRNVSQKSEGKVTESRDCLV